MFVRLFLHQYYEITSKNYQDKRIPKHLEGELELRLFSSPWRMSLDEWRGSVTYTASCQTTVAKSNLLIRSYIEDVMHIWCPLHWGLGMRRVRIGRSTGGLSIRTFCLFVRIARPLFCPDTESPHLVRIPNPDVLDSPDTETPVYAVIPGIFWFTH